jgi:hypothetical protein
LRRAATGFLLSLLLVLAPACGGGSGSTSTTANIRFVQGSIDAPTVDFVVNGTTENSNMLYGNASKYVSVNPGTSHVQAIPVDQATGKLLPPALLDQKVSLADSANETIVMTGPVAQLKPLVLNDGTTTTGGTTTTLSVRVVNISTAMGPADVYIVPAGTNLASTTAAAQSVDFDQDTGYVSVDIGTGTTGGNYDVYMTVPGTQSVYIATGPINTSTSTSAKQTVLILDSPAGGYTFTVLTDQ